MALRYRPDLPAPFLVAKGEGLVADRLVDIAHGSGVPVVEGEGIVDALYPEDIGAFVPVAMFEIVAMVFAFVRTTEEA